jgi:predicted metal-dependent hydrolase
MDREIVRALVERLNRDAAQIATRFGLTYHSIEAERPRVRRRYGVCYANGRIRIRLRHNATGEPLRYSSLVNTLCHELAHLRHFNHGERFKAFYLRLLGYARREGLYQPRPRLPARAAARGASGASRLLHRAARPQQLTLFG